MGLDLRPEWLAIVRRLLSLYVPDAEVLAFGSRVRGTSHNGSDLDLVVRDRHDASRPQRNLTALRAAFSESNLPILVDVLDWAEIPDTFRREILQGGAFTIPH